MNITTTACNFNASSALNQFIREQLADAFAHLDGDVVAIDVFMEDINGPKGGVDKQALVRVHLRSRRVVTIETEHENLYAAIRLSVRRARHAVSRRIGKSRQTGKQRIANYVSPQPAAAP